MIDCSYASPNNTDYKKCNAHNRFFSCFALFPLDNVVIKIDGDTILHASSYLFSPIKPNIPSYKYSQFNYCVQLHKLLTYSTVENYT